MTFDRSKIVTVDGDAAFRSTLSIILELSGFDVVEFDRGEAALSYAAGQPGVDLFILDWDLPASPSIGVLRKLRERQQDIPVIIVTKEARKVCEETALQFGALDYIEKSRGFAILLKRIELAIGADAHRNKLSSLARSTRSNPVGRLRFVDDARWVVWNGETIRVSASEYKVIRHLVDRTGHYVDHREIYDLIRGKGFSAGLGPEGYRTNVRAFVKRVRAKFKMADQTFEQIESQPGVGYRWRADDSPPEGPNVN